MKGWMKKMFLARRTANFLALVSQLSVIEFDCANYVNKPYKLFKGLRHLQHQLLKKFAIYSTVTEEEVKKEPNKQKKRTWTAHMVCLADRLAYKAPTAAEKQLLFKAGLGLKKIKFEVDDDEEAVRKRITSSETEYDSTEVIGFPQLRNCGGFELMHCAANCRELVVIDGSWAVKELKANGCPQAKIYLRPIQKSLTTKPLSVEKTSQVREKCISCNKEFLVHELRKHTFCAGKCLTQVKKVKMKDKVLTYANS